MRGARLLFAIMAALAVSACARQQPVYYATDPNTGQPVRVMMQPQYAPQPAMQPQYAQSDRGLYATSPAYAQQSYGQPQYEQQPYAQQPMQPPASGNGERGLMQRRSSSSRTIYVPPNYAQQPYEAQPQYVVPQGGPYAAAPNNAYAAAPAANNAPYTLDSGDRLRIVVFGQDGITNSYTVDAGGNVNLPLVGSVPARGFGTQQLSQVITERLKKGFVREPHVTVEVETYRPFFILGEVTNPGQYPYVANMTAETAIAIAGGFAPRASKSTVKLTRNAPGQQINGDVPLSFPLRPGDTILVKERWF
jgi:polysaccharide biosynthesis/export protein